MTAEQEQALAGQAREAEERARAAVRQVARLRPLLRSKSRGTNYASLKALDEAVAALVALAARRPKLARLAREARGGLADAKARRWELAWSCKRIAYGEARKFRGTMAPEELAQEGMIGLYNAALRFDPARGLRFSTYARWWVRAQISRAIDRKGSTIRMPSSAIEQRRNLRKLIRAYGQHGEPWTAATLAEEMGLEASVVVSLLGSGAEPVSLSEPASTVPGDDRRLEDTLSDGSIRPVDERLIDQLDQQWVSQALAALPPRVGQVVRQLYGLDRHGRTRTLQEVGDLHGLSKERIRQIRVDAFDAIRAMPRDHEAHGAAPLVDPLPAVERLVLQAVRGGHCTPAEVAEEAGIRRGRAQSLLRSLAERGYLERHGVQNRTRYTVPGQAPPPVKLRRRR